MLYYVPHGSFIIQSEKSWTLYPNGTTCFLSWLNCVLFKQFIVSVNWSIYNLWNWPKKISRNIFIQFQCFTKSKQYRSDLPLQNWSQGTRVVVLVLGSRFFTLVTLGFLSTVNGQPHRGISPPKPALWSRSRLGKNHEFVCHLVFVNPSVAFAASSPQLQLMLVFLSPSILFINTSIHPSVHPLVCPPASPFVQHVFCPNPSFCRFFSKASCKDFFK